MKRKTAIIVLLLCLFAGVAAFVIIDNRKGVTGNHIANRDAHSPDMEYVDGTYLYTPGQRGDKMLQIQFEIKRGAVQMKMKAPDGATLYINYYLYRGSFISLFPPFYYYFETQDNPNIPNSKHPREQVNGFRFTIQDDSKDDGIRMESEMYFLYRKIKRL